MNKVEIYIGYTDHTWSTTIIEIPSDIEPDLLETVYWQEVEKLLKNNPQYLLKSEVAFVGMYNKCPFEEEEKEDRPSFFAALVEYCDPVSREHRRYRYIIEAITMTEATKKLEDFTPTYYTLQMKPIIKTGTGYVDNNGKPVTNISRILLRK
jgi:hypothetical protein